MALLELQRIAKSYGRLQALRDVSLKLAPGAIGLVGNNGAGKSTLLKVLLGLLRPDAGEGSILGLDVWSQSSQIRGLVGYMPEITATVPLLKGAEFVTLSGDLYGMPHQDARRRAHEVLNYVGLGELRYRRLDEYSTGNLQRLKLAAALVHDPQLLLLDEPTNGLDPNGRAAMLRTIEDLIAETGKSVILCTHLLGDVERICEHVVVLHQGTVKLSGPMSELKQRASSRFDITWDGDGADFVASLQRAGLSVTPITFRAADKNGHSADIINGQTSVDYNQIRSAQVIVGENWNTLSFFQLAQENGVTLRRLRPVEENLQDLFLRVTSNSGVDPFRRDLSAGSLLTIDDDPRQSEDSPLP